MINIVKCTENYWDFVRHLRNNDRVQHGFIKTADISQSDQYDYMKKHSGDYFIGLYNGQPIGYVGCIEGDIRICVDPDFQNKGFGKVMISFISDKYPDGFAKIKIDNEASINTFERCGFKKKFYILES